MTLAVWCAVVGILLLAALFAYSLLWGNEHDGDGRLTLAVRDARKRIRHLFTLGLLFGFSWTIVGAMFGAVFHRARAQ